MSKNLKPTHIRGLLLPLACLAGALLCAPHARAAERKLSVLVVDGVNDHDWAAGTRAIQTILEGTGRFTVDVCTSPQRPDFAHYDVVVNNFNGGESADGVRWPREVEQALESYVRGGGGLVIFHAAANAFLNWPAYNQMIGLGWRAPSFGPGLAVGPGGKVFVIPKGAGLAPGHGPRHDFEVFVREPEHPITRGLPPHWLQPSEQLRHGQHGPAEGITILTYAFSEISQQGEPMDWVHEYGKGRVYVTALGHTWKNEANPNLDNLNFQALLARGVEWAATGKVTLPVDLGWKPLFNGKNLDGWGPRGECIWTVMQDGVLLGVRSHPQVPETSVDAAWPIDKAAFHSWFMRQAWLYTKREFGEFDLHVEYYTPPKANSGVSLRDRSWAHGVIGEPDSARPDLAQYPKTSPAHIGYEIQVIDAGDSGAVYSFVRPKLGAERMGEWNSMEIESRNERIRVRLNGQLVSEYPGDPARSKVGPIGLQLHDQGTSVMYRNIRIREMPGN